MTVDDWTASREAAVRREWTTDTPIPSMPDPAGDPVWMGAPWRPFPSLQDRVTVDVCVVGLGGSGLACVGRLLDHGLSVAGVDAGLVASGAAGRNGGFLLAGTAGFYHRTVERLGRHRAAALYRLTLREMDRMSEETPEAIRRTGSVRLANDDAEADDCRAHLEALRADGFPAEPWEGAEGVGLLLPTDGSFQPVRRCRTLAQRALVRGARLFERTPAVSLSGKEVVAPEGRISCGVVVVAVDGKLEGVLPELAGRVRTARLQMLATAPTDRVVARPIYARYGWEYWQQLPDGRIALGGFRDVGGDGEWTHDIRPTRKVQRAMEDFLRDRLGVTAPVTHRWAAAASWNSSGLPLLEEVRPGVWAVGAYCGTGNVMGSLAGRAVAELVSTGNSNEADLIRGKDEAAAWQ